MWTSTIHYSSPFLFLLLPFHSLQYFFFFVKDEMEIFPLFEYISLQMGKVSQLPVRVPEKSSSFQLPIYRKTKTLKTNKETVPRYFCLLLLFFISDKLYSNWHICKKCNHIKAIVTIIVNVAMVITIILHNCDHFTELISE